MTNTNGNGRPDHTDQEIGRARDDMDRVRGWRKWMESPAVQKQLDAVVARSISPERLVRTALTSMNRKPDLLECTQASMLLALMEAGALGLEPTGVVGHGYLVPRFNKRRKVNEAHFDVGYKGFMALALRHPDVVLIDTAAVRNGDEFEYVRGAHPTLVHRPDLESLDPDPESITHVYSCAWLRDAPHPLTEVMSRAQVEANRERSQSSDKGPWVTDWEPMALKTVVRRLCGWKLPLETEAQAAIAKSDALDTGKGPLDLSAYAPNLGLPEPAPPHPLEDDPPATRTSEVGSKLRRRAERVGAEPAPRTGGEG